MSKKLLRIAFLKLGNIGTSLLVDLLLDERADREDIDVRVVSSGAKIGLEQSEETANKLLDLNPDLAIVVSPNAKLSGPTRAREIISKAKIPVIVVSDKPALKVTDDLTKGGFGYIIVTADSMLGARREFLDPAEMALFNVDVVRVLSATGAFNVVFREIDRVVDAIKAGKKPELPRTVVDKETATEAAGFQNPYAKAKAMAAYEIAERVASVTQKACFVEKDWKKYVPLVASAHEMMRTAAALADEAREIEKRGDSVLRTPHYIDGKVLKKRKLIEKPKK